MSARQKQGIRCVHEQSPERESSHERRRRSNTRIREGRGPLHFRICRRGEAPLWPALRASQQITVFSARHERMGVEIADGYARATGQVGVALTGTGPGATNTLTGIAGAYADNIPVLLLMGQHPLGSMGREIQQEVPSSIFDSFVKWKGTMSRVEDIPAIMRRAFTNLRSGSPGPVVLEMPQDVLMMEAPDEVLNYEPVGHGRRAAPDAADIERAAEILLNSQFPVMNVGGGVLAAEAWDEAMELAELMGMPVASTLVGKGAFPENHPLSVGGGVYPKSRYASGASYLVNRRADAVLAVGNSFRLPNATDGRPIPEGVSLIHINADPGDLNKIYQADVPILADAKLALRSLIDAVRERMAREARPLRRGARRLWPKSARQKPSGWENGNRPSMTLRRRPTATGWCRNC